MYPKSLNAIIFELSDFGGLEGDSTDPWHLQCAERAGSYTTSTSSSFQFDESNLAAANIAGPQPPFNIYFIFIVQGVSATNKIYIYFYHTIYVIVIKFCKIW